tara:strand:+ start:557 stop:1504 length:948 start_codon:yes stop_codon:yes gene_type:complete
MQLYKQRDFSSFFSDTFEFIRLNGKHFFKYFFIINGFFVLILAALSYVFSQLFLNDLLLSANLGGFSTATDTIINGNPVLFILLLVSMVIVGLFFAVLSYAYTPIYFRLYEKTETTNFSTREIVNAFKSNAGKILLYLILGFLLFLVLIIPLVITGAILAITLVGILLLPLLVGFVAGLYNMTLLEFINQNTKSFFDCFGYAWKLISSKFWPAVGCMGIFYFISYLIQISLSFLQSIFNLSTSLTVPDTALTDGNTSVVYLFLTIVLFVISFLVGIILNCILQINQSIVYFGLKEMHENINTKSEIDLIGGDLEA